MAEKTNKVVSMHVEKGGYPKDASIIHLYKRKGNPQVCDNHRGISLSSIGLIWIVQFFKCV